MIGIINYGMGNLASVKNAFDYLGIKSSIIADPMQLQHVDKIVLPGVGAFGMAMENLHKTGFSGVIKELVLEKKKPILGICLGMQLLLESSTEHGDHAGLALVRGRVLFFGSLFSHLPVPHMGWNDVEYSPHALLYKSIQQPISCYFVHSYYCVLDVPAQVAGTTHYGISFHSSVEDGHIFGCQFHPEKSQKHGLAILHNFNSL